MVMTIFVMIVNIIWFVVWMRIMLVKAYLTFMYKTGLCEAPDWGQESEEDHSYRDTGELHKSEIEHNIVQSECLDLQSITDKKI